MQDNGLPPTPYQPRDMIARDFLEHINKINEEKYKKNLKEIIIKISLYLFFKIQSYFFKKKITFYPSDFNTNYQFYLYDI